jgi:Flp pilus assembly protein TadB
MIVVSGILAALLVVVLMIPMPELRRRGRAAQALSDMWSMESSRKLGEKKTEKPGIEYLLLSAGWDMDPRSFRLLQIAVGLALAVITWMFMPGLPALVLGGIAGYAPQMILLDRAQNRGREIEKHMPLAVVRLSTGLLTGGSIRDTLNDTAASLDAEGPNPLAPELRLTALETQTKSVEEALDALARRSPSESLSNLAHLLKGYAVSGGIKYAEALNIAASNTQKILAARNNAHAEASGAFGTARIIIGGLVIMLLILSADPTVAASFQSLGIQIFAAVVFVIMGVGYWLMMKSEREVV